MNINTIKYLAKVGFPLIVVLFFAINLHSCKPSDESPKAEITVTDSNGTAIANAKVVLYCVQRADINVECNVSDTQYTDGVGKANFMLENPAVLKASIIKYNTVTRDTGTGADIVTVVIGDTLCAEGFVPFITNEFTEKLFVLGKCDDEE